MGIQYFGICKENETKKKKRKETEYLMFPHQPRAYY